MSKKFVIAIGNTGKYIRKTYYEYAGNMFPMITTRQNLIHADLIFNDSKSAQDMIDSIIAKTKAKIRDIKKGMSSCKINFKPAISFDIVFGNDVKCTNNFYYEKRVIKECNKLITSNMHPVEFVPELVSNRKRKATKRSWENVINAYKFCHICGTNMTQGKYLSLGQMRICPFCLKSLGEEANTIIQDILKDNPEYEKDYQTTTFLGHI